MRFGTCRKFRIPTKQNEIIGVCLDGAWAWIKFLEVHPDKETTEHEAKATGITKGATMAYCTKKRLATECLKAYFKTQVSVKPLQVSKMLEELLCDKFQYFTNTDNPKTIADHTIDALIDSQYVGRERDRIYWRQHSQRPG